jgi:CheY-like chemotaxis protein
LCLPIATDPTTSEASQKNEQQSKKGKPLRVLAMDDDPLVLINTVAMLEVLGHDVLDATSAMKALEIIKSGKEIDLVVSDQAMPQMTGMQLAEALYRISPQVRVVIATGYAELPSETQVRFTKLDKPFSQADLERAIAEAPKAAPLAQRLIHSVRQKTNL